jgi:hypothetical protein
MILWLKRAAKKFSKKANKTYNRFLETSHFICILILFCFSTLISSILGALVVITGATLNIFITVIFYLIFVLLMISYFIKKMGG